MLDGNRVAMVSHLEPGRRLTHVHWSPLRLRLCLCAGPCRCLFAILLLLFFFLFFAIDNVTMWLTSIESDSFVPLLKSFADLFELKCLHACSQRVVVTLELFGIHQPVVSEFLSRLARHHAKFHLMFLCFPRVLELCRIATHSRLQRSLQHRESSTRCFGYVL